MTERLAFSHEAQLAPGEAAAMATCLLRLLGPALGGLPSIAELVVRARRDRPLRLGRDRCLDVCAELLECASRARRRGHDVDAYALEGVEARLLDALVVSAR